MKDDSIGSLKDFTIPRQLTTEKIDEKENYAAIWVYPFNKGYAISIGNALRRVLLSSIPGFAVSGCRISLKFENKTHNVRNEFETLPGMKEDIITFFAHLKRLEFFIRGHESSTQTFNFQFEQTEIKAKDFENAQLNVHDPEDAVLIHLMEGAQLSIELRLESGYGYKPAPVFKDGILGVDSLFSPVKRVNFRVEEMIDATDFKSEKIFLEVQTKAFFSPLSVIAQAAQILMEYFKVFSELSQSYITMQETTTKSNDKLSRLLSQSVDILDLSVRAYRSLEANNIKTLQDLVSYSEAEVREMRNLGQKSLDDIKNKLQEYDLYLGMPLNKN